MKSTVYPAQLECFIVARAHVGGESAPGSGVATADAGSRAAQIEPPMPTGDTRRGARTHLDAAHPLTATFPVLPSPPAGSRKAVDRAQYRLLDTCVTAAALFSLICGHSCGRGHVWHVALVERGRGEEPKGHPAAALTAPAIAPAGGERIGTVARGSDLDQRPVDGGAASAALPMSATTATGAKRTENLPTKSHFIAVLPKIPHINSSNRVPNRPLRPRRGRFGTLLELLQCGIFGRLAEMPCNRTKRGHSSQQDGCRPDVTFGAHKNMRATPVPDDCAAPIAGPWRADVHWLVGWLRGNWRSECSLWILRGLEIGGSSGNHVCAWYGGLTSQHARMRRTPSGHSRALRSRPMSYD